MYTLILLLCYKVSKEADIAARYPGILCVLGNQHSTRLAACQNVQIPEGLTQSVCTTWWLHFFTNVSTMLFFYFRILAMYEAKTNTFWTFWPIIKLIKSSKIWCILFEHLWTVGQKSICPIFKRWFISWIIGKNVQKLLIGAVLATYIASILKWFRSVWEWICKVKIIHVDS